MGTVLKFSTILFACWMIRGVVTNPNHDEDKGLNNKHSNQNSPGNEGFYFDEQKANDDNVKTGRAIQQSAWSKEDKEQTQPIENKTDTQFSSEFSFKNSLSYLLNMLHDLKKDIFGLKEMASLKNTQNNPEEKVKRNKMGKNDETPKSGASTKNSEFEKENKQPESSYITYYYQNNDVKFIEDDLETSRDESDDSSHKPNEGDSGHEVSKNKDNICVSECLKTKRKSDRYSEGEEPTATPSGQIKLPEESDKQSDNAKDDDFRQSTTKPSKRKQNNANTPREETEKKATTTSSFKTGICRKKSNGNSYNLNGKNEPTEKPLISAEYARNPKNQNFDNSKSERSNPNKTTDNLSKPTSPPSDSKSSKNKGSSSFDNKSDAPGPSTTLLSQISKDDIYPGNIENETNASGTSSEKPNYEKQQEQTTSLKPEDQIQALNYAKSFKNNDTTDEYTTVSLQSQEVGGEILNHEISTDTQIKDNPKESENNRLNVDSSHTTVSYSENEPNSKIDRQRTNNSFNTGNAISPTTSENIVNADDLNKYPTNNLNGRKISNENEKSENFYATRPGKNDSETQRDEETVHAKAQQLKDDSGPEKSLKTDKVDDSNRENKNEEDDNLTSVTANDFSTPKDSNRKIQNRDAKRSDKPQEEVQKDNESQNKRVEMHETSPDYEYEDEEENDYFYIYEDDMETDEDFNENQEEEFTTYSRYDENNDEMDPGNAAPASTNESQISKHSEYTMEEKSPEQYNTFLEYFYKHSNSTFIHSLKNQSDDFSR